MTDEEIRTAWNLLDQRLSRIESATDTTRINTLDLSRRKTALDRLTAYYLRFSIISVIFLPLSIANLFLLDYLSTTQRLFLSIGFAGLFLLCFVMDSWLYRGVKSIDIYTMSVERVANLARYYKRWHLRFMLITCPWAAAVVTGLIYCSSNDPYLIAGCCVGLGVGLAIGLSKFLRFMDCYRELTSEI